MTVSEINDRTDGRRRGMIIESRVVCVIVRDGNGNDRGACNRHTNTRKLSSLSVAHTHTHTHSYSNQEHEHTHTLSVALLIALSGMASRPRPNLIIALRCNVPRPLKATANELARLHSARPIRFEIACRLCRQDKGGLSLDSIGPRDQYCAKAYQTARSFNGRPAFHCVKEIGLPSARGQWALDFTHPM